MAGGSSDWSRLTRAVERVEEVASRLDESTSGVKKAVERFNRGSTWLQLIMIVLAVTMVWIQFRHEVAPQKKYKFLTMNSLPVRMELETGYTEILTGDGWQQIDEGGAP